MMKRRVTAKELSGTVSIPPSKSVSHRAILAAALSEGKSRLSPLASSQDIQATLAAVEALGTAVSQQGTTVEIEGISPANHRPDKVQIDCIESGSTMRFLIPVAAALGIEVQYFGRGKLPERPITPYLDALPAHGVHFDYRGTMPFTVSGRLLPGVYELDASVSSQFITGLLMALPLLEGDSLIRLHGKFESASYVEITLDVLRQFGVQVQRKADGYFVPGGQCYLAGEKRIEGDYSNAAFFLVLAALGNEISCRGLAQGTTQGDRKILNVLSKMGAEVRWQGGDLLVRANGLHATVIDASDIPDLIPVLTVAAAVAEGKTEIINAGRLRLKESDRLHAMADCLGRLGAEVDEHPEGMTIVGKTEAERRGSIRL